MVHCSFVCGKFALLDYARGGRRGLETFSQLTEYDWDNGTHHVWGAPWKIYDAPRFPHRAFMVDTARHWLSMAVLERLLDGMAATKLNVLHWYVLVNPTVLCIRGLCH